MLTAKHDGPLETFATAAGILPTSLSLLIRTALLAGFFIWSAWCMIEMLQFYKTHPTQSIANLFKDYIRISFLVSVIITLVFVA